ncbi:DNA cytosine methyltransferase [Streptomyces sp. NBC_01262]|uniref:DNA cytosine methyltransferase n=1 Tax=Streptomyces sp. NBC_01262 TaxID=2903803 RepID=UPI002E35EED6|nr:DNA cytosine methyltransferase [Streptomyces sp. NBC_01262]
MSGLRLGSVCTGYGGLDMAVQEVFGGSLAWVADNDPGAARILAHHHPQVPNLGDITAVGWTSAEPVDVVIGGYPCQPFSTAGHRKGTKDARHIWPHIATALGVLRPRYAVFENVAGHLSLGFDTVLADLARLGFDAEWLCVSASEAVGAAHQRRRLFLLAWPADPSRPGLARRRAEGPAPDGSGGPVAHPEGVGKREPADQAHPLAGSRDPRQMPGGGSGQPAADTVGRDLAQQPVTDSRSSGPSVAARGDRPDWGRYEAAIARWEHALGRPAPWPTDALGRLNPPLVEWLMGLPAGHVTAVPGLSRTAQLKALGNGVVPQQATAALRLLADRLQPWRYGTGAAA